MDNHEIVRMPFFSFSHGGRAQRILCARSKFVKERDNCAESKVLELVPRITMKEKKGPTGVRGVCGRRENPRYRVHTEETKCVRVCSSSLAKSKREKRRKRRRTFFMDDIRI